GSPSSENPHPARGVLPPRRGETSATARLPGSRDESHGMGGGGPGSLMDDPGISPSSPRSGARCGSTKPRSGTMSNRCCHDPVRAVARQPLFASLSEAECRALVERSVCRSVKRDEGLFREGDPCRGLYLVVEGRVRTYRA